MAHSNGNVERDFGSEHLDKEMDSDTALHKIRTAGSISISPDLFEKLYLQPRSGAAPAGQLRKAVGNPTPYCLIGFLLSLTPLACDLMNWRGAGAANGSADIGAYYFFGGLLMVLGSVGEFAVGNTFPMVVFGSFGAFWLQWGATLQPFYSASGNYAIAAGKPASMGSAQPTFLNAYGFFFLWMGVLCFIYLICALRTNVVFVVIFLTLVPAFGCLAGAFWKAAEGNMGAELNLVKAAGACAFITCVAGWWIFAAILLAALDFPFSLPVGDLSHIIKGMSEKSKV